MINRNTNKSIQVHKSFINEVEKPTPLTEEEIKELADFIDSLD
jgi:hypothetical protein